MSHRSVEVQPLVLFNYLLQFGYLATLSIVTPTQLEVQ
uniref:Uncharacterized protein n=1 Tax=Anguilla anguilla TaxID=7936 RepID=A0A0E9PJI2_ANGAN